MKAQRDSRTLSVPSIFPFLLAISLLHSHTHSSLSLSLTNTLASLHMPTRTHSPFIIQSHTHPLFIIHRHSYTNTHALTLVRARTHTHLCTHTQTQFPSLLQKLFPKAPNCFTGLIQLRQMRLPPSSPTFWKSQRFKFQRKKKSGAIFQKELFRFD